MYVGVCKIPVGEMIPIIGTDLMLKRTIRKILSGEPFEEKW